MKTGKGQVVDAAMIDGSLSLMSFFYSLKEMGHWQDNRESNLLDGGAHFYDTYKCSDKKFVAIGSIEPQFYSILLEKLEIQDERFSNHMDKAKWPELKVIIAEKIKLKTREEWIAIFSGTDACVTPVLDMDEAKAHEHNVAREAFINIDGFVQPAPSPRFSHDRVHIKHNSKEIGSDNLEICSRFGLDPDCFN
jgi:alpha-methylacyl-CoA racemase